MLTPFKNATDPGNARKQQAFDFRHKEVPLAQGRILRQGYGRERAAAGQRTAYALIRVCSILLPSVSCALMRRDTWPESGLRTDTL